MVGTAVSQSVSGIPAFRMARKETSPCDCGRALFSSAEVGIRQASFSVLDEKDLGNPMNSAERFILSLGME